jgi:hypothetical protein
MKDETFSFSANGKAMNTVFGLTSTKADGTATISDISFYTRNNLVSIYPEMQKFLGVPDDINTPLHASYTGAIYSLNGAKIASHTDITNLDESYRGIYIIGNKKWIK